MKQIWLYSKSFGNKTAFYIEQSPDKFFAGVVQGSEMEAALTALMAYFTLVGPENAFVFFHPEQHVLLDEFKAYENEPNHYMSLIDKRPFSKAFKKYHELTRSFSFLMSYYGDKSKEPVTERLKFKVEKLIEREKAKS